MGDTGRVMPPRPTVVIGGGAAGTLAAIHLASRAGHGSDIAREVVVLEPAARLGEGIAYGTTSASHLLNVRAAGMSAFPERPAHFVEWARGSGLGVEGPEFLPRPLYARYLRETLDAAMRGAAPGRHVRARATGIHPLDGGVRVTLSAGTDLIADDVVLATGNGLAPLAWLPDRPGTIRDPWAPAALEAIGPDARVAIVGSGLTAVDVVLSLRDRGHRGPMVLVSSHGLLPQSHAGAVLPSRPPAIDPAAATSARGLVRALRDDAASADDWRQTVDGARPMTVATWRALPALEQRRAIRHASRYWEIRRHRMAPQIAAVVADLRDTGRLVLVRGRVRGVDAAQSGLALLVRSAGSERRIAADAVIACVGPSADPLHDPLLASGIEHGTLARHPLGLGLAVDAEGRAQQPDGTRHEHVWTIGSLRRGAEWESTAVPELRVHAREVAAAIVGRT